MKVSDSIKKNAVLCKQVFEKRAIKGNPKQLYDASAHLIIHGGKRLRPIYGFEKLHDAWREAIRRDDSSCRCRRDDSQFHS